MSEASPAVTWRGLPPRVRIVALLLIVVSVAAVATMVALWGAADVGAAVRRSLPALPAAAGVHAVQLLLSGLAWRCLLEPPAPSAWLMFRLRWIREAMNTLLPLAGLGGGIAAGRLLARATGLSAAAATANVTADLTIEALAQIPFLVAAIGATLWLAPGHMRPWQAALALLPVLAAGVTFVVAQRAGLGRLVERLASRLGAGQRLAGLDSALLALHGERRRIGRALAIHTLSWSLGGAEVWVILRAIGHPVGPLAAFALEGFGMAARSAGFVLPASLAAQEAGFVLAGAAFGVPAATAIALSMVKRLRELAICLAGLVAWQRAEFRR